MEERHALTALVAYAVVGDSVMTGTAYGNTEALGGAVLVGTQCVELRTVRAPTTHVHDARVVRTDKHAH